MDAFFVLDYFYSKYLGINYVNDIDYTINWLPLFLINTLLISK